MFLFGRIPEWLQVLYHTCQTTQAKKRNTKPVDFKLTYGKLTDYEVTNDPYWVKHKRKHKQFKRVKSTIQRASQYSVLCNAPICPVRHKNTWDNRLLYVQWQTTHHKTYHSGQDKNFICVSWLEIEDVIEPNNQKKKQRYKKEFALVDSQDPFDGTYDDEVVINNVTPIA